MDPDKALDRLRRYAAELIDSDDVEVADMAAIFNSIDNWIISGGFLPADWKVTPAPERAG